MKTSLHGKSVCRWDEPAARPLVPAVRSGYREDEVVGIQIPQPHAIQTDAVRLGGLDHGRAPALMGGILDIVEGLTLAQTGKFFRFTGEEREF